MAVKMNNCAICGKEYEVCSTCAKVKSFTPWRTITDTIDCYRIYTVLSSYTKGASKEVTKEMLSSLDLSDLDNFQPDIKAVIKDIMKEEKPKKIFYKKENKNVIPVVEETSNEELTVEDNIE